MISPYQHKVKKNSDYFGLSSFLDTVIVTPLFSISATQRSLSPQLSFNIRIISMGIIVLEDLLFVSAGPILVSYINFMIPPFNFLVYNMCSELIFNLIFCLTGYPTKTFISNHVLCNIVRELVGYFISELTKLCHLDRGDTFFIPSIFHYGK